MKFSWVCGLTPSNNRFSRFFSIAFFVAATTLVAGCNSHPMGPPEEDVMKADKLVEVLIDMHYYEGIYAIAGNISNFRPGEMRDTDTLDYYKPVLDKHGIDRQKFENSLKYYSYNPDEFEDIYDMVVDELNRRLRDEEMKEPERPGADGL